MASVCGRVCATWRTSVCLSCICRNLIGWAGWDVVFHWELFLGVYSGSTKPERLCWFEPENQTELLSWITGVPVSLKSFLFALWLFASQRTCVNVTCVELVIKCRRGMDLIKTRTHTHIYKIFLFFFHSSLYIYTHVSNTHTHFFLRLCCSWRACFVLNPLH